MKTLLTQLKACKEAIEWAGDKSWEEIYNTCHRGDWLLWLFAKTNPAGLQLLTLVKGHCANTVRHLMTDQRSIDAVDAAIAFGEGRTGIDELNAAAAAAADAAADAAYAAAADADAAAAADADAADAADYAFAADHSAVRDAYYAAYAAYTAAADAYTAAYTAAAASVPDACAADAKKENQKLTADIVRKYIPIEKFNISIDR